jgi:flagellar basal-body rod modification protein FlgD
MATAVNPTSKEALIASFNQPRTIQQGAIESVQDRFLTLLVTQMQNQDPLNPLENAEVTTQLAQISTVGGIDKLNGAIESMAQGLLATQSLQAGGLIGRGVLAAGSTLVLEGGKAQAGLTLQTAADHLFVNVISKAGERVATLDLGPRPAGTLTFAWDGKNNSGAVQPDGVYSFEAAATQNGREVEVERLGFGRVQSVTLGAQDLQLNTYGLGSLGMSRVAQIL